MSPFDFYALSAHKAYGPTGVGALYVRREILEKMPPYQGGGEMIRSVSWEKSTFNDLPYRFEPGTPNIAGIIAFGTAISFLERLALRDPNSSARKHEQDLLEYGTARLLEVPGVKIIGTSPNKAAILSFVMDCAHAHDIGTIVDRQGIALRTGHHCCMPLMKRLGIPGTARASLAIYSSREDLDRLSQALQKVREVFI